MTQKSSGKFQKGGGKYPLIYCPPQLRIRIESIGNETCITGITPTLNHIVADYEKRKFGIKQPPKYKGMKWI